MTRIKAAPSAQALWDVMGNAIEPITVSDAARRAGVSASFARKLVHAWAREELLERSQPAEVLLGLPPVYIIAPNAPKAVPILTATGTVHARDGVMSAAEFARIRRRLDISLAEMARQLGRTGAQPTLTRAMRRFENGDKPIDELTAERARILLTTVQGAGEVPS